jgi:hypothetical protein
MEVPSEFINSPRRLVIGFDERRIGSILVDLGAKIAFDSDIDRCSLPVYFYIIKTYWRAPSIRESTIFGLSWIHHTIELTAHL